ncbi:MAG: cobalamin-binding protein [Phormidesmis sp.]
MDKIHSDSQTDLSTELSTDLSTELRIVSLIPSATEIVAKLGYGQYLVGRSHECDFPAFVKTLPICTEPKFNPVGTSSQIHERVTELLASALSVYRVNVALLTQLRPTHIITQAQCEVCAVSLSDVEQAVTDLASTGDRPIQIVSLQPNRLADVWADMERVAAALASIKPITPAPAIIQKLQSRLPATDTASDSDSDSETVRPKVVCPKVVCPKVVCPKVVCIEWTDPLMAAGNWVPELVALAGGTDSCGKAGEHSDWMSWETLTAADPDIIIVMPCGYDMDQTRQATQDLSQHPDWATLIAVKTGRVYLTDGNQYFNRPGPRLVDSYEILAEIIQQKEINACRHPVGWEQF